MPDLLPTAIGLEVRASIAECRRRMADAASAMGERVIASRTMIEESRAALLQADETLAQR